jgi:aspartate-semialdehyde dehydrogenase
VTSLRKKRRWKPRCARCFTLRLSSCTQPPSRAGARGHSVSLALSLRRETIPAQARRILSAFPGIRVLDKPWAGEYPTPLRAAGIDDVLVGRVRRLPALKNGLSLFACGDNLRKGNALNAVQVAECVLGLGQSR